MSTAQVGTAETLEDRLLLTNFLVANTNNAGGGSLRQAIINANNNAGPDRIVFNNIFSPIVLSSALPSLTGTLEIDAPSARPVTVNANGVGRVFNIAPGAIVTLDDLIITGGNSSFGAGIANSGSLVLQDSYVHSNVGTTEGAGIWHNGTSLVVINSAIANNSGVNNGGGIASPATSGTVKIINSTISGNSATGAGGGIKKDGIAVPLTIINSTITGNRADSDGAGGGTGGGIFSNGSSVTLHNSIVAGNVVGTGTTPNDLGGNAIVSGLSSLIGDAGSAGGLQDKTANAANNNFVGVDGVGVRAIGTVLDTTLQNNGGHVPTHSLPLSSVARSNADFSLAKDAGGSDLTTDGRGAPYSRSTSIVNGGLFQAMDLGAYQSQMLHEVNTTVDETNDNSTFSLREAIEFINTEIPAGTSGFGSGARVVFAPELNIPSLLQTITLNGNALTINNDIVIEGFGAGRLEIDADGNSRVFNITHTDATVEIGGLRIKGGQTTGDGGGINNTNGATLTLRNVEVTGNNANDDGGGLYTENEAPGGRVVIIGSTFSGNTAGDDGGAIYSDTEVSTNPTGNILYLVNSTISGNSANDDGGGILVFDGTAMIVNSTITGNRADADGIANGDGGGIWTFNDGATFTTLHNTIVAGNLRGTGAGTPDDISNKDVTADSSFNLIGDAATAGGLTDGANGNLVGNNGSGVRSISTILNPLLKVNVGGTPTHALPTISVAINRGNNTKARGEFNAPLIRDQRDGLFARIINSRVDIGAFEYRSSSDIFGRASTGTMVVHRSNGSTFQPRVYGNPINPSVDWDNFLQGDFNNDGLMDMAGRSPSDGYWRVLINTGSGFTTKLWGRWSPNTTWTDLSVGDFNGDGLADVYGRAASGTAVIGLSDGTKFIAQVATGWSTNVTWSNMQTADLNGDGRSDIITNASNGRWVASIAQANGTFSNAVWGFLSPNVTWNDVTVGDFNGDGSDDVFARSSTGTLVVWESLGNTFSPRVWGALSNPLGYTDLRFGDFNRDGMLDVTARSASGTIVIGRSNGSGFQFTVAATVNPSLTWPQIVIGDFNADGRADLGMRASSGTWVVGLSNNTTFNFTVWGSWSSAVTWDNVAAGEWA